MEPNNDNYSFLKQKQMREIDELEDQEDNNRQARASRIQKVDTVEWITPSITNLAEGIAESTKILMLQVSKMTKELKDQQYHPQDSVTLKKLELESTKIRKSANEIKSIIIYATEILNKLNENNDLSNQIFNTTDKGYNIQDKEIKDLLCKLAKILTPQLVAKCFNVSPKNINRWLQKGTKRKEGGGRKILDPQMEQELKEKYDEEVKNHNVVSNKKLKELALICSKKHDFKASRSWFKRFKRDNGIINDSKRKRKSTQPSSNNNVIFFDCD